METIVHILSPSSEDLYWFWHHPSISPDGEGPRYGVVSPVHAFHAFNEVQLGKLIRQVIKSFAKQEDGLMVVTFDRQEQKYTLFKRINGKWCQVYTKPLHPKPLQIDRSKFTYLLQINTVTKGK